MKLQEITADNFAPFGEILTIDNIPSVKAENEFDWYPTAEKIKLNDLCCTGLLNCRAREKKVARMECHKRTSEVLFPLIGDSILAVAPAVDNLEGNNNIQVFRLPVGKVIAMKPGTWHAIPYPVENEDTRILVLFKDGTGDNDLNFKELSVPLVILE